MSKKFRNKYRIQSNRMPGWNYAGNELYFITLVTQNRECNLGEISESNGHITMELSEFGKIVHSEWIKSFTIRNEITVDEYIIMPNHLHAIVVLEKMDDSPVGRDGCDGNDGHVETHGRASLRAHHDDRDQRNKNPELTRKPKSISSFIGGFKSAVNSKIDDYIDEHRLEIPKYDRNHHFFQPNYFDRIIRNQNEYNRIKKYIINNPETWYNDNFNPVNLKPC
ncbi:MAG TPA: transposase [bacterium]|nr:transposase [bacterium]